MLCYKIEQSASKWINSQTKNTEEKGLFMSLENRVHIENEVIVLFK